MLLIVGRKIVLQRGDYEAFRVVVHDKKGQEVPLSDTDIITLRMNYTMETATPISFKKEAKLVKMDEDTYMHIICFGCTDTRTLPSGDYYYDVILENDNKRFTIVPKSILTLEDSMSFDDIDNDRKDHIEIYDADTKIDYESIMSATPLVGSFPETNYSRIGGAIDEEIIIF